MAVVWEASSGYILTVHGAVVCENRNSQFQINTLLSQNAVKNKPLLGACMAQYGLIEKSGDCRLVSSPTTDLALSEPRRARAVTRAKGS